MFHVYFILRHVAYATRSTRLNGRDSGQSRNGLLHHLSATLTHLIALRLHRALWSPYFLSLSWRSESTRTSGTAQEAHPYVRRTFRSFLIGDCGLMIAILGSILETAFMSLHCSHLRSTDHLKSWFAAISVYEWKNHE